MNDVLRQQSKLQKINMFRLHNGTREVCLFGSLFELNGRKLFHSWGICHETICIGNSQPYAYLYGLWSRLVAVLQPRRLLCSLQMYECNTSTD
jgi:hypothetical protein